ncbi:allatostatin-A receptor-like [Porites lutea]|uniref:allatostatin-A receptor-like n=1 Tax=Porites lutea TaxID=51062 RepID=UPI003CC65F7D
MNTTANGSSSWSCSSLINPEALKVGATVAFSLILVVSLVGNSLIVLIVYKTPTLRKPINMLIANMAMSDLLYPIFLFPVKLVDFQVGSWLIGGTLGQAWCKMYAFLADISTLVSIQSLVLITVDRYAAVVVPLRSPFISRKVCRCLIVGTWVLAAAFHSPYLFNFNLVEYQEEERCMNQWEVIFGGTSSFDIYLLSGFIFFFYIPFVVLVILYSKILIKLKGQVHPGEKSASAEEQRKRRNRNVLKMTVAIVVAFFICWIPFSIQLVTSYFVPKITLDCKFWVSYYVAYFMAYTNCAINPIICLTFSSNYRQALRRLVNCCDAVQG